MYAILCAGEISTTTIETNLSSYDKDHVESNIVLNSSHNNNQQYPDENYAS